MDWIGDIAVILFLALSFMLFSILLIHIFRQEYRNTGKFIVKQRLMQTVDDVIKSKGYLIIDL